MGRTELENEGLRNFKSRWGAVEEPLYYSIVSSKTYKPTNDRLEAYDAFCDTKFTPMGMQTIRGIALQVCGMNTNLWHKNAPSKFWQCQPDPGEEVWQAAIADAYPSLGLPDAQSDIDTILALTFGEERFGKGHWDLGISKKAYYLVKPLVPRSLSRKLRQVYQGGVKAQDGWPIERRYVEYLWAGMRQMMIQSGQIEVPIKCFWPNKSTFAFVLTHDIETAAGQEFVEAVADLEESLGFRSSFNFVPEKYKLDYELMNKLRQRGFEVGVHGLKHDGKLFDLKVRLRGDQTA